MQSSAHKPAFPKRNSSIFPCRTRSRFGRVSRPRRIALHGPYDGCSPRTKSSMGTSCRAKIQLSGAMEAGFSEILRPRGPPVPSSKAPAAGGKAAYEGALRHRASPRAGACRPRTGHAEPSKIQRSEATRHRPRLWTSLTARCWSTSSRARTSRCSRFVCGRYWPLLAQPTTYEGRDQVIHIPSLSVAIPLAEVYRGIGS